MQSLASALVADAQDQTLAQWQAATPGAGTMPQDNWDGDQWDDLLEFALGSDPASGVPVLMGYPECHAGLEYEFDKADGGLTIKCSVLPGRLGVTYELQQSVDHHHGAWLEHD